MAPRRAVMLAGSLVAVAGLAWLFWARTTEPIDSFARCADAGYPVLETSPPVCRAGERSFIGATPSLAPTPLPVVSQPFELLVHGDSHGSYPAKQEAIESATAWQAYWKQVHAGLPTPPPLISVDFATSTIIALSYGPKPTGGYDIKATGVAVSSAGAIVDVTQTVPGEGCVVTASITNPYTIIRTAKLTQPISFRTMTEKHHCQ